MVMCGICQGGEEVKRSGRGLGDGVDRAVFTVISHCLHVHPGTSYFMICIGVSRELN